MQTSTTLAGGAPRRRRTRAALALLVCALALTLGAGGARADFGIESFSVSLSSSQAGEHADVTTAFRLPWSITDNGEGEPDGYLKDLTVELPPGIIGDPTAVPRCSFAQLDEIGPPNYYPGNCPQSTQVGAVVLTSIRWDAATSHFVPGDFVLPVYNMVPRGDQPALFAFNFNGLATVPIEIGVRSDGDYGITASLRNISTQLLVIGTRLTLWGNPAAASHDTLRVPCVSSINPYERGDLCPSSMPPTAFMTNPTQCATPVAAKLSVTSYQEPERVHVARSEPLQLSGCDLLRFEPTVTVSPETTQADAPSGYEIGIHVPRDKVALKRVAPDLRDAVVKLPAGVAINPSAADGLAGCTDEQSGIGRSGAVSCPDASSIGMVEIESPLLAEPLQGRVWLGAPTSADPASGRMFRIFLTAEGSGVAIRLLGSLVPDPVTGQVTATFSGNPQLPFTDLTLRLNGGQRAVLANPPTCGPATTTSALAPWSGTPAATPSSAFGVTWDGGSAGCPATLPFAPTFTAGTTSAAAGAFAPLTMTVARADREQALGSIGIETPPGLLGMISQLDLCGEAAAAAGTCGEGSRIGSVTVASGAGSQPFNLPGRVYMTGPYKGAPFGLSIVVPAEAGPFRGPFSLGDVVVRAAVAVDRRDAHLTITSDPLPQILKGVPLRLRSVNVHVDRQGFMFNPTRCQAGTIAGRVGAAGGANVARTSRFAVGGCRALPFRPRMTLQVGARGRTRKGLTTPLKVTLAMTRGQANNRVVDVTLPRTLNSRLEVVNNRNACTPEQFAADRCPQQVGTATAVTPVLRDPLRGPVYFVRNPARRLPDLVVALRGQVAIDLVGKVTITRDLRLKTSFDTVPDVPISRFTLDLVAGRNGAIGATRALCSKAVRAQPAELAFTAQSGKRVLRDTRVAVAGCGGGQRGASRR